MAANEHQGPSRSGQRPCVELVLRNVSAMFNSMDPSPFHEKDLDQEAEDFIVGWTREYPLDSPLILRIHLVEWPSEDPTPMVREALHNYFAYRAEQVHRDLRQLMAQGRTVLLIGLSFLATCLFISQYLLADRNGTLVKIMRESLTIVGWVAMWRPLELYLYDWWPIRRREKLYTKLSTIPVEVVPKGQ